MFNFLLLHSVCNVERAATLSGIYFDIFVVLSTGVFLFLFAKREKNYIKHFAVVALGVFIFELFTSPLWNNPHLGKISYVYQDVSWILTIGWATLILSVVILVDMFFARVRESRRFFIYMAGMAIVGIVAEVFVVNLGLRSYSPEVLSALKGYYLLSVPIEALYYIPVFSALIIGFYKYWVNAIDNNAVVPERNKRWGRNLGISVLTVLLFELMIDPVVTNANLPSWSYIYRDISVIMTGSWVLIIWLVTNIVDTFFIHYNIVKRFSLYLVFGTIIALPLEWWFIVNGYRVYGESAIANFSGIIIPFVNLPIEIATAVPIYVGIMVAFIRYWEIILNKKYE